MYLASISRAIVALLLLVAAGGALSMEPAAKAKDDKQYRTPPSITTPADNQTTPARVALGKALFFDPRLSGSQWMSCASCHNPSLGWSDGLPTATGEGMKKLRRPTPTIINVAYNQTFMWDGRAASLEEQALGPIQAKDEMNMDMPILIKHLNGNRGYREMFARAYPGEDIAPHTVAKAIAAFERTVVSTDTPFDRWRAGDNRAVGAAAKRGFDLFRGKGNCEACHQGYNFTDDGFHNIGLKTPAGLPEDEGRYAQRKVKSMKGAFKTPTLREVALTVPYMHNGIYKTLEEVVDHYDRGGDMKDNLDPNILPLKLTAREKTDLVEFMKSLTSRPVEIGLPRLPQ